MSKKAKKAKMAFNCPPPRDSVAMGGGIATMFRLPYQTDSKGLDACFVGIPFDSGTGCNRTGARQAPGVIRSQSVYVRSFNAETGADPYRSLQVADVGDINCHIFDLKQACADIKSSISDIISNGCCPFVIGGDRTITYPILQALKEKHGPVGIVMIDGHADVSAPRSGSDIWHGSPLRLAVNEGLLDCSKVWQIGIRCGGLVGAPWGAEKGFKQVAAHQCWNKSLAPLMTQIRDQMGPDTPVYFTFCIDGLDPSCAPGTGTHEIGGLTMSQALEIIRGCRGLNLVGGDICEVSPPYDCNGMTSIAAANLFFEMLCVLPKVKYSNDAFKPMVTF